MSTAIEVLGFIIVLVMGSAIDSASAIPVVGVLAGLAVMVAGYGLERWGF